MWCIPGVFDQSLIAAIYRAAAWSYADTPDALSLNDKQVAIAWALIDPLLIGVAVSIKRAGYQLLVVASWSWRLNALSCLPNLVRIKAMNIDNVGEGELHVHANCSGEKLFGAQEPEKIQGRNLSESMGKSRRNTPNQDSPRANPNLVDLISSWVDFVEPVRLTGV